MILKAVFDRLFPHDPRIAEIKKLLDQAIASLDEAEKGPKPPKPTTPRPAP